MTAEESLERYASGERDFSGVQLESTSLSNAIRKRIILTKGKFGNAQFENVDLSEADLSKSFLEKQIQSVLCLELCRYFD